MSLKIEYQSGPESRSSVSIAACEIAGAGIGPSREQGGGEIGDRTADRLREILPCQRILLLLERAHAEHKPRDPIAAVDLHQTIGQAAGLLDIAFGEHGRKARLSSSALRGSDFNTLR